MLSFDLKTYLDDRGIRYWEKGKNVKKGNVNVNCPFCPDGSNHMTVYPSGFMKCWICGFKGHVAKLVMAMEKCSGTEAESLMRQYPLAGEPPVSMEAVQKSDFRMPKEFTDELPNIHRRYLEGRNFDPARLQADYGLMACGNRGPYKFRIVAPVVMGGRTVSFQTRDVTGRQTPKYRMCPDEDALVPRREVLYNLDSAGDTAVIVEGITDVWRGGAGFVATLTAGMTFGQALALQRKGVKRVFIFYDEGAEDRAEEVECLLPWAEVFFVGQPDEYLDPAEMPEKEISDLRKIIFKNEG